MKILQNKRIPATSKAELEAELIFYNKFSSKMSLEPLLDPGAEADFTGKKGGHIVYFDVTANIEFIDINKYVDIIQKRMYEIVYVNRRNEEVLFYPLRFPICKTCNRFSHYILYLEPPISEICMYAEISDTQTLIQYCSSCGRSIRLKTYHYLIPFFSGELEYLIDRYNFEEQVYIEKVVRRSAVSVINFFEKVSDLLISGITENAIKDEYGIISQQSNNYKNKELHWKHPLARDLKELRLFL